MKRVAVVRGGPSEEHDVSMKTGQAVKTVLLSDTYSVRDIVITKSGEWLIDGKVYTPDAALEGVDAVFLALHGTYGEDGQIQRLLTMKHIPYTGSGALASGLAFNKVATKRLLTQHDIKTPKFSVISGASLWSVANRLDDLLAGMSDELFVKPVSGGSSFSAGRVSNREQLEDILEELLPRYEDVLVEEFVPGREVTVGVLQHFRDHEHYALPVIEIVPPKDQPFFSNEAKYNGQTSYYCPADFNFSAKSQLSELAIKAHKTLGCDHYSRSDFIVAGDDVYFLELNTLPGLTEHSLLPKSAETIGLDFTTLVRHLIDTAKV